MKKFTAKHIDDVGAKDASSGEMMRNLLPLGIEIPDRFAITVDAYYDFLSFDALCPQIQVALDRLDRISLSNLAEVGASCREMIKRGIFSEPMNRTIVSLRTSTCFSAFVVVA